MKAALFECVAGVAVTFFAALAVAWMRVWWRIHAVRREFRKVLKYGHEP
jgi:hypothetical protein